MVLSIIFHAIGTVFLILALLFIWFMWGFGRVVRFIGLNFGTWISYKEIRIGCPGVNRWTVALVLVDLCSSKQLIIRINADEAAPLSYQEREVLKTSEVTPVNVQYFDYKLVVRGGRKRRPKLHLQVLEDRLKPA